MIPNEQDKNFLSSCIDYRRKTYSCNVEKCENYMMMIWATIHIELMSFDQLIDRIKELKDRYPIGTKVFGSADLSFYFNKEKGDAK